MPGLSLPWFIAGIVFVALAVLTPYTVLWGVTVGQAWVLAIALLLGGLFCGHRSAK